jgi:zinc/manganese transport system permease protein
MLTAVLGSAFLANPAVRTALTVGPTVAVVAGVVGVFTVIRGQSFAGEALADVGATGASGAFLLGVAPLWGFVGLGVAAAGIMEMIGIRRPRGRDLATGIVLGAGLGLAALFLYWDSTYRNTTGAAVTILFGSLFAISSATVPLVVALSLVSLVAVAVIHRPLLLSSVSPDLATARGVPVRLVGLVYLLAMAVTVSLAALTIGAILSTALLVGPAATALRLTNRPGPAAAWAALLAVFATVSGVVLAWESFYWPPAGRGWPVSFFVVTVIFALYLLTNLPSVGRATRRRRPGGEPDVF